MMLQLLLLVSVYIVARTNAAVNFYGPERPYGDYVSCEVPDVSDDDVSAALVCGDLASVTAEFACNDLGGDSTCVPTHSADTDSGTAGADSDATGEDARAGSKRSLMSLKKRAEAACDEWTLECKNQYQSTTGWCESDYTAQYYDVQGYAKDVWCVKPCTDKEIKACSNQACPKAKKQCEESGLLRDCGDALTKCAGSPVKVPENSCNIKWLPRNFAQWCAKKNPACMEYKNGACTLNGGQYKAYEEKAKQILGSIIGEFGK